MTYTVSEVAKGLHVSEEQVRRWCRTNKLMSTIKCKKKGRMISAQDLISFAEKNKKHWINVMKMVDPEYVEIPSFGDACNDSSTDVDKLINTLTNETGDACNDSSADIDALIDTLTNEISDSNEKFNKLANIALITSEMCALHQQLISKKYDLIRALFELQAISNKGEKL